MVVSKRRLADYLIALALVLLATLIRWLLDSLMNERGPFLTYFMAVGVASWIGGAGPGVLVLILGGLLADYVFIPPRGSLGLNKVESQIGMGIYLFTGSILVVLSESQRRARASAERSATLAIDRQARLEAEIFRREQVEQEREALLLEQSRLRAAEIEQSSMLASLFDQAPIGIVLLDTEMRYLKLNSLSSALIDQTPEQLIGRTIAEVLGGTMPEDEIARIEALYRRTLETGEPFVAKAYLTDLPGPDGAPMYVDWSLRRVERAGGGFLGVLGTYIDVTEEVVQGRALRKSEELFRLAAEAVDGLIYDADMTTGRVERTRGLLGLIGYEPEEVPPTVDWWVAQIHPDDLSRMSDASGNLQLNWSRLNNEYRVRHRLGHYVQVMDRSLAETDADGKVIRLVGCTQDLTEIRRAEEALREADRRKDEFLAVLAHEIRNPLASIRNSLRLIRRTTDQDGAGHQPGESERDRAMAERQVGHLARLIDDLMDVSRIGQGLIELRLEPVELTAVLARALEAVHSPLEERNHRLEVALPDQPVRLEADPTRLEQVFGNLLTNAIKYTNPGGLIRVEVEVVGDEVAVRVRDNGLGIEPEMLPRIFGMFVQEGKNLGHAQGGLGIGLGLSRSLVELHGGRISATSRGSGLGSEFEVRLPLVATEPAAAADPAVVEVNSTPPRRRVLVVDDNEDIAISLGRVLSRIHGQEVRIAHDGPSALRLADEFQPEIILLDIGMPDMDGCEVARRLRMRPEFSETLLVALSGWGQESDRRRSEAAGIDHHLVKPVDPDALGELIARAPRG